MANSSNGQTVQINADEMSTIYNYLKEILEIFKNGVQTNSQNISKLNYYQEGKATKVVREYEEILNKTMEISDHYERIMSLVAYTLKSMMETDQELAQEILKKVGV